MIHKRCKILDTLDNPYQLDEEYNTDKCKTFCVIKV